MDKVTNHTRAGKGGKKILCPSCDTMTRVYNFNWKRCHCGNCNLLIDKIDWLIKPNPTKKPTPCFLCGRMTIYQSQIEHPYHYKNPAICFWCHFDQVDSRCIVELKKPVTLQCHMTISNEFEIETWERCTGTRLFYPSDFQGSDTIRGLRYYNELYYRCNTCNEIADPISLIIGNIDIIRAASSTHEEAKK